MPRAALGGLEVRGLVPRGLGPAAADRLRRAVEGPLPAVLPDAFAALEGVDPGAVWVLRELNVELSVPASDPDPQHQARRIADGLAAAIELAVARGPTADSVRFRSRAGYVAAFVRARLTGAGPGWVFDRFGPLAVLPAGDALIAAARLLEVPLHDVVAELAGDGGGWERLVVSMDAGAARRVADRLARENPGAGVSAEALEAAAGAWAELLPGWARAAVEGGGGLDRARLLVLGRLLATLPATPALVAATWRLLPDPEPGSSAGPGAGTPARHTPAAVPRPRDQGGEPSPGSAREAATTGWFASPGAVAFLLLPDLDQLLATEPALVAATPAAAAVRASILAGVLDGDVGAGDPAVRVAAGASLDLDPDPDPGEVAALRAGPLTALAAAVAADPGLGFVHPADAGRFGPAAPAVVSGALFRRFSGHLHGFGRASAAHLVPRVLPPGGRVLVTRELIEAVLAPAQLAVLLSLAGLDAFACRAAWLDARVLVSHEEGP